MTIVPLQPRPAHRLSVAARRSIVLRRQALARAGESGMTTAEYAVGTLAACAFAGVLWAVVRSGAVRTLLQSVIERALNLAP